MADASRRELLLGLDPSLGLQADHCDSLASEGKPCTPEAMTTDSVRPVRPAEEFDYVLSSKASRWNLRPHQPSLSNSALANQWQASQIRLRFYSFPLALR